MTATGAYRRPLAAVALAAAALAPAHLSAQQSRSSSVPRYRLLQVSVDPATIPAEEFAERTQAIRSCNDGVELAKELDGKVTRNRNVRASALPDELQATLRDLENGRATPVFSADGKVMRVIVLCGEV